MIIISFQSLSCTTPKLPTCLRGITHPGFLSSLYSGTMSVSLVLLTLRADQTEQALSSFTEDCLCPLVGPTQVFLTLQELPEVGLSDSRHQILQKKIGFEVCLFWSLSAHRTTGRGFGLFPEKTKSFVFCSQKTYRSSAHSLWWLGLEGNSGRRGRWAPSGRLLVFLSPFSWGKNISLFLFPQDIKEQAI